jgi:GDPmannose 4,6-dehydratase
MSQMKLAMVSGCTGQDGSNLVELLLSKGYKVIGLIRRNSCPNSERYDMLCKLEEDNSDFKMEYFDLADAANINHLIQKYKPDYFFNTAAMSHVAISFNTPESTLNYNLLGVLRILEAIKNFSPSTRFLQCSSSEQFGITPPPQSELSRMQPQSPYGIAKLGAFHLIRLYRNAYGIFACNTICFNHEGPRRTVNFVTRKITRGIARIIAGKQNKLVLGNLAAKRDWGDSRDYVRAMEMVINHNVADDFVVATNETHSIAEFVKDAFEMVGLNHEDYVETSDKYLRPAEVPALLGDSTKLKSTFGWEPKYLYKDIIRDMLEHDLMEIAGLTLEQARGKKCLK